MKAAFESLNTGNHSFLIRKFEEKSFSAPYHFHPEYELTFIPDGCGKRYVGTHMQNYFPGRPCVAWLKSSALLENRKCITKRNLYLWLYNSVKILWVKIFLAEPEMNRIRSIAQQKQ